MTDSDRYPNLSTHGEQLLKWLREHPNAPRFTAQCGHRLTPAYLARVNAFEAELRATPIGWAHGETPQWLSDFVELCYEDVPYYRRATFGARPKNFFDTPTLTRADIAKEPWAFVPDSQPLDGLIVHSTSGTTGHPLDIISHPVAGASYLPIFRKALEERGVTLTSRRGQVGVILVGYQQKAYTYPSVIPQMDEAGHLKLNLHPNDWHDPADRAAYLDACNAELYTGDPVAFAELLKLPMRTKPKALLSTAMMLTAGLKQQLEVRFVCPVFDLYSMNESGPIAIADADGFKLLHHRLYVEILDEEGAPCPPGVRGEVVITGGFNHFLPLLRYRTNDTASLEFRGRLPVIVGLQGRKAVLFRNDTGHIINSLDVNVALRPFALSQFALHQSADGALHFRMTPSGMSETQVREALASVFGAKQRLAVEEVETFGDKVIQYTSELELSV